MSPAARRPSARGMAWRRAAGLSVALVAAVILSGFGTAIASARSPISDDGSPVALGEVPFAERAGYAPAQSDRATDAVPEAGTTEVVLTLESPNPWFYAPENSSSPALSSAQVGTEYGVTPATYAALEQYFGARGLSVVHAWPDRLSLSLDGPAAAVGAAFGTTLLSGSFEGRPVTFAATAPTLPPSIESEIAGVSGLSSGFSSFSLPALGPVAAPASGSANPANLVTPTDARQIYDVSGLYNLTAHPTYAAGKGIVLLLWGWGYSPSDIATFFSDYYPSTFPAPSVTPYPVDGAPLPSESAPGDPSNGSREMTLDLEWSGSMAPGASLDAVYAPPGPAGDGYSPTDAAMIDAINTAVSDVPNVAVISMSFGSADGQDPSYQAAYETAFATATKEHITLFAATGDTGGDASGTGCTGVLQPEYPAASPQVVAVGGTDVTLDRSVLGTITGFSESAWSDSGGGYSADYRAPAWQLVGSAAAPIQANGGYRGMPDVAASAAYDFMYFNGQMDAGEGTSFASPLWAGTVAEMDAVRGSDFGFLTPALYTLGATATVQPIPFHDVTSGENCIASAGPGWDPVTGWGSPDSTALYEHLVSAFVNLTLSLTPTLLPPGGSVAISALVTNASSGAPIASVPVLFSLGSDGIGGPCSGTFGSSTVPSNGAGRANASLAVAVCYLGSSALATVTVESDGYYGVATSSVQVNLLGFAPALAGLSEYPANIVVFTAIMSVAVVIGVALGLPPAPRRAATAASPGVAPPPEPPNGPAG